MNLNYYIPVDKKKRNFVGMRLDNLLLDRIEKESQYREITLSDTIRRLCLERLDSLYDRRGATEEKPDEGKPNLYQEIISSYGYANLFDY